MKGLKNILWLAAFTIMQVNGQDVHFSNIMGASKSLVNPANTGSLGGNFSVGGQYRSQWGSISNPFRTYAFNASGNIHTKKRKGHYYTGGLDFFSDQAGEVAVRDLQVRLSFASHLVVGRNTMLGLGIQGGYLQQSTDMGNAQWDSQYIDGAFNPGALSGEGFIGAARGLDISSGLYFKYTSDDFHYFNNLGNYFQIGLAAFHLNQPAVLFGTDNVVRRKYNFNVEGYSAFKNSTNGLAYNVLFSFQGPYRQYVLGAYYRYLINRSSMLTTFVDGMAIAFGVNYRVRDAVAPCLIFEFSKLSIYTSYDLNISRLTPFSGGRGGLEIGLRFTDALSFNGYKGFR